MMNKQQIEKNKELEKKYKIFHTVYNQIMESMNAGVPIGKTLETALQEDRINYAKVDKYFDSHFNKGTLIMVGQQAAQLYSSSFISKRIVNDYLESHRNEIESFRASYDHVYSWPLDKIDLWLSTIFFYARHRDKDRIKSLPHYLPDREKLISTVKGRISKELTDILNKISSYHDELSYDVIMSRTSRREDAKTKFKRLIDLYDGQHQKFAGKYQKKAS